MADKTEIVESEQLSKELGFWALWAIGVGAVVGDGIFLLLGDGIATAGPGAIASYLAAGLFMLFIALAVSDLAVGLPSAGAMWIWGRELLGDYAGFVAGLSYAAGWIIAGGSTGLALGRITQYFVPEVGIPAAAWGILFITIFALIQLGGVVISSRLQLATVLILVGIVLIFGISSILSGDFSGERFSPFFPNGVGSAWAAMAFGMYAYMGPLTLTTAGDEAKNPNNLPRALVAAVGTFLLIYSLAMVGMIGLMGFEQFSSLESPFTTTAEMVWGSNAGLIINFAAWIAAFTTLFMGTLYSAPRMLYKMGDMKILPDIFGNVYEGTRVPLFSTVFVWACSVVLLVIAHYELFNYAELSNLLTFAWLVSWAIAIIAAVKYRLNYSDHIKDKNWKQPLFPLFPILGMSGVLIILYGTFRGTPDSLITGIIFLIVLSIIYYGYGQDRMKKADLSPELGTDRSESIDD